MLEFYDKWIEAGFWIPRSLIRNCDVTGNPEVAVADGSMLVCTANFRRYPRRSNFLLERRGPRRCGQNGILFRGKRASGCEDRERFPREEEIQG